MNALRAFRILSENYVFDANMLGKVAITSGYFHKASPASALAKCLRCIAGGTRDAVKQLRAEVERFDEPIALCAILQCTVSEKCANRRIYLEVLYDMAKYGDRDVINSMFLVLRQQRGAHTQIANEILDEIFALPIN